MADPATLQGLIESQNLTAETAMQKYGIDQAMVDQLGAQGVNFLQPLASQNVSTSLSGGEYVTTAPTLESKDMSGLWSTSSIGDQYNAWKAGPTYEADLARAQTYLDSPSAIKAPTTATGGYTQAPPLAQPEGGTVLPGNGLMDAYTVPNAMQARVNDISAERAVAAAPITAAPATASGYSATDATASTWTPDSKATVQGQIKDITASDSPLMQQAATRGLQQANRRGLGNSSMAVQAGQAALYDAALPIAQQDANTFSNAGQFNAQNQTQVALNNAAARNAAAQFVAQTATDVSKFNADNLIKVGAINQEQANRMAMFNASEGNRAIQTELQVDADIQKFNASESNALIKLGMDSQTKMALAQVEASYKMLMQTSASSAEVYKSLIGQMGAILGNKDMDENAKSLALGNLIGALNASLGVMGSISNLDLPELDFSSLPTATVDQTATGNNTGNVSDNAGQDANGSGTGGNAGDGVGSNANGDAAGVGAGPM
jgi:hypothetical protein